MKANASEKIYVHVRANKELGTTWHGKKITNSDIEYVRKDAFIEKAVKRLEHYLDNGVWIASDVGCREKEAIIEDFRRYLEE